MGSFPSFLLLQKTPRLILFCYKTPNRPEGFSLVFVILNSLLPPLRGPEGPAMYPRNFCMRLQCFLFFPQRWITSWRWMFSCYGVVSARICLI